MAGNERDHTDNKGDKAGRSADEEGLFGDKRTQHYDASGQPIGRSRNEKGAFGEEYLQHYDETGEEAGRSKVEKGVFGDEYTQHYDSRGEETGRSRAKKGMFGDEYVQHYNARGDETGRTRVDEHAREMHERERRQREMVEEAGRAYHADGALKLKDLKNVAWGPTLKLAFWRGVACAPGMIVLVALLADGNIFVRLLTGLGGAAVWALTAWYGAVLNYILWRAIGAVLGPLTLGIGYLVANFGLLVLAFIMSLGDPIIAYITRRSPHFFQIDDYPTFSMKSMIFIVNTDEPLVRRAVAPMRREEDYTPREPPRSTTSLESDSQSSREPEQDGHASTQSERATHAPEPAGAGPRPAQRETRRGRVHRNYASETNEPQKKGSALGLVIFAILLAAAGVGFFVLRSNLGGDAPAIDTQSSQQTAVVEGPEASPVDPAAALPPVSIYTCDTSNCRDIWTTSVYSFAPAGGGPGGGLDDEKLRVGGYGDEYWSLIRIDLPADATEVNSAVLEIYNRSTEQPTDFYLDAIIADWGWTPGDRLWWRDRPQTQNLSQVTVLEREGWVRVDITELYNAWVRGERPNYGVALRPVSTNNNFDEFVSSNNAEAELHPRIVVERRPRPPTAAEIAAARARGAAAAAEAAGH